MAHVSCLLLSVSYRMLASEPPPGRECLQRQGACAARPHSPCSASRSHAAGRAAGCRWGARLGQCGQAVLPLGGHGRILTFMVDDQLQFIGSPSLTAGVCASPSAVCWLCTLQSLFREKPAGREAVLVQALSLSLVSWTVCPHKVHVTPLISTDSSRWVPVAPDGGQWPGMPMALPQPQGLATNLQAALGLGWV